MKPIEMNTLHAPIEDYKLYRCPNCAAMFSSIIVFNNYDFYDAVPRYCPYCRIMFTNGGDKI